MRVSAPTSRRPRAAVISGRLRAGFAAAFASSLVAVATAYAAGEDTASRAVVTLSGADAVDVVDCRNVAEGGTQTNRCAARARGGAVSLANVDIHFRGGGMQVNGGAVDVIAAAGGNAAAGTVCVNEAGAVVEGPQVSICLARAKGGRVAFHDVRILVHHKNGRTTTRRRNLVALAARPAPVHAVCVTRGGDRTDCDALAHGGNVEMRGVDMVDHGSNTTRSNIDVSITGGDATAVVYCANEARGGQPSVQVNRCSSTAEGGDVDLRNVRLHVYEP